jgi:seryl-tRNA synthetase
MLDIRWIRENPDLLVRALMSRGSGEQAAQAVVDDLIVRDEARRSHLVELQQKQERRNQASKEIGNAMRNGDMELAERLKQEVADIKGFIQSGEATERTLGKALEDALAVVANIPLPDVPVGADEKDNVELRRVGEPRRMDWAKEHFEIGEALGMMDFERAAQTSRAAGSRCCPASLRASNARSASSCSTCIPTEHGYREVQPPLLVRDEAAVRHQPASEIRGRPVLRAAWRGASGAHPDCRSATDKSGARRNPAGETLPRRMTALTPCFRSEAGSAGRDTRGMLRQHQFNKVELVSITDEETSLAEHERMTACAEEVLKRLGLAYRVVVLCTGDMGFGARKTYDIEVWLPGQGTYREISSCSVCGDFQARRMNARYRGADGKVRYVHTLNGSGVAVGRALIAVMETYQNEDGTITVPEALRPYMGGLEIIGKE